MHLGSWQCSPFSLFSGKIRPSLPNYGYVLSIFGGARPAWLPLVPLLQHPTSTSRLEYSEQGGCARPGPAALPRGLPAKGLHSCGMISEQGRINTSSSQLPFPSLFPGRRRFSCWRCYRSLPAYISRAGSSVSSHRATNSLLPIIFHTGKGCFQSSSNSRQCLDPQMSISQSAWGFARGIELPKGPQTTWHQPRLCSAAIPSYMDIPSSGPWDGFPWSREHICLPPCPIPIPHLAVSWAASSS